MDLRSAWVRYTSSRGGLRGILERHCDGTARSAPTKSGRRTAKREGRR